MTENDLWDLDSKRRDDTTSVVREVVAQMSQFLDDAKTRELVQGHRALDSYFAASEGWDFISNALVEQLCDYAEDYRIPIVVLLRSLEDPVREIFEREFTGIGITYGRALELLQAPFLESPQIAGT